LKTNVCGGVTFPVGETVRREGRNLTAVGVFAVAMFSLEAAVAICLFVLCGISRSRPARKCNRLFRFWLFWSDISGSRCVF